MKYIIQLFLIVCLSGFLIPAKGQEAVQDYDGNVYKTVKIGSQVWMAENLKTTTFNDGTPIPSVRGNNTPKLFWYNEDSTTYKSKYGALYNWYAVNTGKLCPSGWHVPSDSEWKTLEIFLGMTQAQADGVYYRGTDQGRQLKFTTGWTDQGNGINSSGFSALPGGCWSPNGYPNHSFNAENIGFWWSSTISETFSIYAYGRLLYHDESTVYRDVNSSETGLSVRCIKD
jgi:uncharacterized protein (TIGR02145 family)